MKLFGVDISGLINKNVAPGLLGATLVKTVPGSRTSGNLAGGRNSTTTSYTARGVVIDYNDHEKRNTAIVEGDRKVLLIGDSIQSLAVPAPGDQVTIEGVTYRIIAVERDPAAATYTCQAR